MSGLISKNNFSSSTLEAFQKKLFKKLIKTKMEMFLLMS